MLSSCNNKLENIANKYLNAGNLQEQLFTIDIHKDTNLVTQQGLKIKIDANSIEASTPTVTIQVKEALTLAAMLKAGLTTQTANGILSSDGMFYLATKEKSTIKKPLSIAVPTLAVDENMQLYKGDTASGKIVWEEPKPLTTKPEEDSSGKVLFMTNCASCHKIDKPLTGPDLGWIGNRWKNRAALRQYIKDPFNFSRGDRMIISGLDTMKNEQPSEWAHSIQYACYLKSKGYPLMTSFEGTLTDKEIDAIIDYTEKESKQLGLPKDHNPHKEFDSCKYYHKLYHDMHYKRDSLINHNGQMAQVAITFPLNNTIGQPADTTNLSQDKVVPNDNTAEYYQFKIEAYGWYNIDVLLKEDDGVKESELMVRLRMPVKLKANVILVIPDKKIFVEGGLLSDTSFYGFQTKDGKILLPQGQTCYLFAVGESGEKLYFSQTSFVAGLSQNINLELKETNKTTMLSAIAQLKLTDIKVDVQEVKNYKGIKALDNELNSLKEKLRRCECVSPNYISTGGFVEDGGVGSSTDYNP